jgi:glycerol-3-phosphate dehydrogenase
MNRQETFASLKQRAPTVLIIGGGINGVGTFRDLALQGIDTLLIDRSDFCSGASSASSRMAHGGIRYLENGEFGLVREAVQERNRLLRNASGLVIPLPTTIPIYKTFSGLLNAPLKFLGLLDKPAERGGLVIKIGLLLYDAFTGRRRTVPRHVFDNHNVSLQKYPHINPAVRYTATYYDGNILSPERLTLELLLDSESEGDHARSLNYVSVVRNQGENILFKDEETDQTFSITPHVIINATGPWIDDTNRRIGLTTHYIGPTKGSHVVVDNPELRQAIGNHEIFFENKDGRIVLVFPLFDKVLIGTSDLPIEDPDTARCTEEEVDYFIEMVGRVFPDIQFRREQIIYRFSGVRPLAYSQARNAGQITRDHHVWEDNIGKIPVYSLVGGKWTSYRAFSEQATDHVLRYLGSKRKADTTSLLIGKDSSGLNTDHQYTRLEIVSMAEREKIVHLSDLVLRRTLLAYLGQLSHHRLEELANYLGESLNWDATQERKEIERTLQILADKHGVRLISP